MWIGKFRDEMVVFGHEFFTLTGLRLGLGRVVCVSLPAPRARADKRMDSARMTGSHSVDVKGGAGTTRARVKVR